MIKSLIIFVALSISAVVGLGFYLQPDDLRSCGQSPSGTDANCQVVGAIVAISGGDTDARTNEAIKLYKNGWSDKLIFSGAASDKDSPSNALVMKEIALEAGVPDSAIQIDELAETTKQNAQNVQVMYKDLNTKSIILVTSGYHQRRASLEFSKIATDIKVINHSVGSDKDWSMWWWLTPTGWYLAVTELFKIILFFVVGTR